MAAAEPHLSRWVMELAKYSSIVATVIISSNILLHLNNYRKPLQQRLMIRIQLIVPLFAVTCYSMLQDPESIFNKYVLESVREVYEAFVIYTFFSLLTHMLGGERNIIIIKSGEEPVSHPGMLRYILPEADISDPYVFLAIKRGVLQYVWLKPIICVTTMLAQLVGIYDVNNLGVTSIYLWLMVLYNFSVTLSLYSLALFWKILWNDLKQFNPVGKFLCVKLIIFASYWQGVILAICNYLQVLPGSGEDHGQNKNTNIGVYIQNAALCIELVAFAIGHCFSFSYKPFDISSIPNGRLLFRYALKDTVGIRDLLYDFRLTFYGDYYKNYKHFDSVEALISHPDSRGRMSRINQGLRYHSDGTQKHWLPYNQQTSQSHNSVTRRLSDAHHPWSNLPLLLSSSQREPSMKSFATSTRAIYSASINVSPPSSPLQVSTEAATPAIHETFTEILNNDEYNYDVERLDEDDELYQEACHVINNYNLDNHEIKRALNYPIVDDMVDAHMFGYKVKKLREDRKKVQRQNSANSTQVSFQHNGNYGSIV